MTPLPGLLGGAELAAWRLDDARFAATWDNGEGAFLYGGRWNSPSVRAVYCAIDPSTAILEVAVHSGFAELAARPHVLTSLSIHNPADVHVVQPTDIPEPAWLRSIETSPEQQRFGDDLLRRARFVVIPSAVSTNSWNLLISIPAAAGRYALRSQDPFVLDPRLQAPAR